MQPPIPSPYGSPTIEEKNESRVQLQREFLIECQFSYWDKFRQFIKLLIWQPTCGMASLAIWAISTVVWFPVFQRSLSLTELFVIVVIGYSPFFLLYGLIEASVIPKSADVFISTQGIERYSGQKIKNFNWQQFKFIFIWSGDLVFVTMADGFIVPRRNFASKDELQEALGMLRILKKSNGQAWQEAWNTKIFGKNP